MNATPHCSSKYMEILLSGKCIYRFFLYFLVYHPQNSLQYVSSYLTLEIENVLPLLWYTETFLSDENFSGTSLSGLN